MKSFLCFAFQQGRLLVAESKDGLGIPTWAQLSQLGIEVESTDSVELAGITARFLELGESFVPTSGHAMVGLRRVLLCQPVEIARLAGRAAQLIEWKRTHRYCGVCGGETRSSDDEPALICQVCEHLSYPRVTPAVIVAVRRGDELLLARGSHLPEGFYSVLAGFVEGGESLEEAVIREIREEVSIEIRNLEYFGSQPWPFPHSLMVAFTAEHAAGELEPDREEILHAEWFSLDRLPAVPPKLSIARALIDDFVESCGGDADNLEEWGPR